MKKYLVIVLLLLFFVPLTVFAKDTKKAKVKVYLFVSGGCPYCEAEESYLKSLDSYNKKFTIVNKELYVDHIDWEPGKDFELGKKVVEVFNKSGFADAAYTGTPFVVISDIYAATGYNTDLEATINAAYEEGDKDAVSCIAKGKDDCVRLSSNAKEEDPVQETKESKGGAVVVIIGALALVGIIIYVIKNKNSNELEEKEEKVKEETKEVVKKVKKTVPKKTNNVKKTKNK